MRVKPALILMILALLLASGLARAASPERVVSMNLCTDQLAMMLAAPGQLISVSFLARDEMMSAMTEAAQAYPVNHGGAEEIFLLQPDLVVTGTWSAMMAQQLLTGLGIRVEQLPIATSLDQVRANITQMGDWLGRPGAAAALRAEFDRNLALLQAADTAPLDRPRTAIYAANGYMAGLASLSNTIIQQAGLANIAGELGLDQSQILDLERVILAAPDLIITDQKYGGWSRAEAIMDHPALHIAGRETARRDHHWSCGTPLVIKAVAELAAAKRRLVGRQLAGYAGRAGD